MKLLVGIIFLLPACYGQILQEKRLHELLLRGIHYTLSQHYDSAETTFHTMIKEFPQHPSGYLYLAGMFQAKYTDYGDRFNEAQYDSLLNEAEELAERMISTKETTAWGYFYSGMADAFRSYTASESGSLPSGFYYGISAGNALEKCLEMDSTFTEAKNILGSYYFWRSKLAWIPFVSDRTDEGISMIKEAFFHPYEKHLASHNLMLIFIDEKRFSEAEYYGMQMLKEYPENRSYLWIMMTLYEQWGKQESLKRIVDRLLESTLNAPVINRYTEATCRLKLAQFAANRNDVQTVKYECEKIIALKKYIGKTKGDLKKKVRQAEDLVKSMAQ
ncbi:MAG: hypothetical protein AB1728_00405 [Bacteroidota bacterium]